MQYLGGKSRTCKPISTFINALKEEKQPYWEPFVGAAWVLSNVEGSSLYASDINKPLIAMWQRVMEGWIPPTVVSEELYARAKNGELEDYLTAFIGFGCSWGGKWFGGYARNSTGQNYARAASESLQRKAAKINNTTFFTEDFINGDAPDQNMFVYCDPPYKGTTSYDGAPEFDHEAFWLRVEALEYYGHTVVVSEYEAPESAMCVLEIPTSTAMRTVDGRDQRIERLFMLQESAVKVPSHLRAAQLSFL